MKRISLALLTLALLASPLAARAGGLLFEASIGSGVRTGVGDTERIPTNIMATLGYGFTDMLKLEVGAVANLADASASFSTASSSLDVDLRGMVAVSPPLFPLYFRGIAGVTSLKAKPAPTPATTTRGAATRRAPRSRRRSRCSRGAAGRPAPPPAWRR